MAGADLVLMLLDDEDTSEGTNIVEIQILENNHGQCGNLKLEYSRENFRLGEVGITSSTR